MNYPELENSFVIKQFHSFYSEIIAQKKIINSIKSSPDKLEFEKDIFISIHNRLFNLLESQEIEAKRRGGVYGTAFHKDAQYIMAALADEVFIHIDWEGKKSWQLNLLEHKFFETNSAGEIFFKKLDKLLQEKDPSMIELGALYFFALSLGFRGKFWGASDSGQIGYYRNQLYNYIFRKRPDINDLSKKLFPQAYLYTLFQNEVRKLPYVKNWIILIFALVGIFLIFSHVIWGNITSDLIKVVNDIIRESAI